MRLYHTSMRGGLARACNSLRSALAPWRASLFRQAADQPLEIPREGPPLGRGINAEVEPVGIAAELRLQAGVGRPPQIGRHHHRRAAEAGKGTGRHAA